MNFQEAENYLLSLVNLPRKEFMKKAKNCQIYLDRLNFFMSILGNPQNKITHYIHITGTSGKGSLTTYMHSILHTAGKRVGSIQSPHPTKITERWKIGNKIMADNEFIEIVSDIKYALEKYVRTSKYDMISYSEILVAIGLFYFAKHKIQWAVIEAGLGGKYDASNIIPNKDISVITNIGLDHQELIGPTKSDIAREKAGIIKPGTQVFTQVKSSKLLEIIKKECKKNKADLNIISKNNYKLTKESVDGNNFIYKNTEYKLSTPGAHQISNAILAIEIAKSIGIKDNDIKKALKDTKQILRLEILWQNKIILDGAHNEDKIKSTVDFINKIKGKKNIHLLVGFSGNKNWSKMVKKLSELKPKSVAISRNTVNPFRKVADLSSVKKEFEKNGIKNNINVFLDPELALGWSMKKIKKNDILLVTGSIFLSGQIRGMLTPHLFSNDS